METTLSSDLCSLSATEIAAAVASGEVSSRAVVEAHLARIEELNPTLNAYRVVLAARAREEADSADEAVRSGAALGPLHGVPVSVKENIDVGGTATTWGVAAMADAVSPVDAPVVAQLRAAGAIVIARSNLPDFALRWHTDSGIAGATHNPWDASLTPGGSSGGEAVALATGMTPLGLGNDLGGSLRWPSQCNGTAACRPTLGRVADGNVVPPVDGPLSIQLFNVQGPMARTVADLRTALAVMTGSVGSDPWHVPAADADGPRAVSVVLPPDTDFAVADGVRRAAAALSAAGYEVHDGAPDALDDAARLWTELLVDDVRRMWPFMGEVASVGASAFMGLAMATAPELDLAGYASRWTERQALLRSWVAVQRERPLVLAPVCLRMPFAAGADVDAATFGDLMASMRTSVAVNLLGLPSVAVPAGLSETGLPLGVQIIGPRYGETLCLDAAAAVEQAHPVPTPLAAPR